MGRNALRVVCNPHNNQISYYLRNEKGKWMPISEDSPLSGKYYTNTSVKEHAKEIVEKIDEIYNRNNRGLDIQFEGTRQSFDYIKGAFDCYHRDRNIDIVCITVTKIAVVGKPRVGKTCLIEGMENLQGYKYAVNSYQNYSVYSDDRNYAEWYEIMGIELGIENIEKAYQTVSQLIEKGLSAVIYCVNAFTGRLEDAERDLILKLIEENPSLTVLIALTMSLKTDSRSVANEMEKIMDQVKIIPILAKEYEIEILDQKYIKEPFGLEVISEYIFEGEK